MTSTDRRRRLPALAVAAAALATMSPGSAGAQGQADNPNISVQNRARPDYDPLNLRAGAFLIAPRLNVAGLYDSNVFARDEDVESDFYATIAPSISARSTWSRHALRVGAAAEAGLYEEFTRNNYLDFDLLGSGDIDVTRDDVISPRLKVSRGHEDRDDPDDERVDATDDITQFFENEIGVDYRHDFTRIYTILRGDVTRLDFEDAGDVDNDDRDRNRFRTGLRIGYKPQARFDAFVDGVYRWIRYDDPGATDRDSEGYLLRAGVGVDITAIIFGELYAGYESVTYENDELDDATRPIFGGQLTWNVTPLTSVIFDGNADIRETTVVQDGEEASGRLHTDLSLNVWHELLRNVLVNGFAGWQRDDFEGIDRTDDRFRLGTRVRYFLNRNLSLDGGYTYITRNSDVAEREFDRHVVRLGITAGL